MEELVFKVEKLSLDRLGHVSQFAPAFVDEKSKKVFMVDIPTHTLEGIQKVQMTQPRGRAAAPIESIPKSAGCYWIYTDEPVRHCLNAAKKVPSKLEDGSMVVYNGVTTNLYQRAKEHMLRSTGLYGEMSGIAVDLICEAPREGRSSHAKCAWAPGSRKLPKVFKDDKYVRPTSKEDVLSTLHLSAAEKAYLRDTEVVCFKNGINVNDAKHKRFKWYFCWVECPDDNLRGYIERKWRESHGVPVLCSYTSGR